jgi:hypothetical protein
MTDPPAGGGFREGTFLCSPYARPMLALCSAHQPQLHVTPASQVTFCFKCPPQIFCEKTLQLLALLDAICA